jgi:squalene-hopene/tetraprenyl-beta-curcumene cyclase
MDLPPDRLRAAYQTAKAALLAERTADGHWVGELSSSALSTATAVGAMALVRDRLSTEDLVLRPLIDRGLRWLVEHQNADGGWGDTVKSFSNISTTMLCRAAVHITGSAREYAEGLDRADAWLAERYGSTPAEHAEAVRQRYGKDRTFSVPILMTSALAGLVPWTEVPALPFELACLPQSWYRFARLPVVSYALPALIAIGQAVYHHRPPWNPLAWLARRVARGPSLKVLRRIQPSSGGFLEATPLTSFVVMSLASIGQAGHPVATNGVEFLVRSIRDDGSWPIDTNLATWVTTLSINALAAASDLDSLNKKDDLRDWLLRQQYKERHPYTGAEPGGWAWTDLPGGVPDADDTPGALLALQALSDDAYLRSDASQPPMRFPPQEAALRAITWLAQLRNRDGGWPTFCHGWGKLPFDRSGSDLTAHVLRAWHVPGYYMSMNARELIGDYGFNYLARQQRPDGSWLPLWFGNQHTSDDENPTYGTARVLAAYRDLNRANTVPARRGVAWLLANQNDDGGWGGGRGTPSSVEETALAVEVLLDLAPHESQPGVQRGLAWLVEAVESGRFREPTPIGFYFAKLWYFERLYPIIFSVAALGRACRQL